MAKLYVVDADLQSSTPFLRGILIHRLQESGLGFDEAYALANEIRSELSDSVEIGVQELKQLVGKRLAERFGESSAKRYLRASPALATLQVREDDASIVPFSRTQLRRNLEASGLGYEQTLTVVAEVYDQLMRSGLQVLPSAEIGRRTYKQLARSIGQDAADRYLAWTHFNRSGRPLLLLVGGVPGSGKSTISSEVAHRLEVVRIQSTDMLREVMRMMVPERLLPGLHTSSFLAWRAQPVEAARDLDPAQQLAEGFLAQARLLSLACEGAINRAIRERVSLILEGVHLHPGLIETLPRDSDAIIVPIMLAVLRRGTLRKRLLGRGRRVKGRRAERYLEHFEEIWQLQSFLLEEADRMGVTIISNTDKDEVTRQIIRSIGDALLAEFDLPAEKVFG